MNDSDLREFLFVHCDFSEAQFDTLKMQQLIDSLAFSYSKAFSVPGSLSLVNSILALDLRQQKKVNWQFIKIKQPAILRDTTISPQVLVDLFISSVKYGHGVTNLETGCLDLGRVEIDFDQADIDVYESYAAGFSEVTGMSSLKQLLDQIYCVTESFAKLHEAAKARAQEGLLHSPR